MLCQAALSYNVHIDVLPAMTGACRFGERGAPWRYSKVFLLHSKCDRNTRVCIVMKLESI